jgi:alkylation response protein AidB-like acyl-CoA dehydrogenase
LELGEETIIDFTLTDDQLAFRDLARRVAKEVYAPLILEWDHNRTPLPKAEKKRLGDLGFLGLALPEEYGGSGSPLIDALIVIEELAKENVVAALQVFESNTGPIRVVDVLGTDEQKQRFIPPVVAGERTMALAISEPDAGSAATDLTTKARLDGDEYVVNGMKRWCTGASDADDYLVYVRLTNDLGAAGVGAVVIDGNTPGLTFGPREELHGFNAIPSADIFLDDVRVPAENLVVPAGDFRQLFGAFSIERLGNSTICIGLAQGALDRTSQYVQERRQFGKQLVEFQLVQAQLADMLVQVEAARLLTWRAASRAGTGSPVPLEASMAKCFANEMAKNVTDIAMQLHGGYGYHREYHVERMHRDAHGFAIGGGTRDMQRMRITSEYLGRRFAQR